MKYNTKDFEEINVNKRSTDRLYFETPMVQSLYNRIEFLKKEGESILKEIDSTKTKQRIDNFDIAEFADGSIARIYDAVDDASQIKDNVIYNADLPEFVMNHANDVKFALNRDHFYVRKARRRLKSDSYLTNRRVIELCDKAIAVDYTNWEAYYLKGIALINMDKYNEAIDELTKSLAFNEDNLDTWLYIGFAYMFKIDYAKAIALFDHILEIDRNHFDALKAKAVTYYYWEKYDEADEFFKKASSIKPLDDKSKEMWDTCLEKL